MEVKSTTKFVRLSPKKARDVAREIQGLAVSSALDILTFTPKKAAQLIGKTLKTAIADAENNFSLDASTLVIKEAVRRSAASSRAPRVPPVRSSSAPAISRSLSSDPLPRRKRRSPARPLPRKPKKLQPLPQRLKNKPDTPLNFIPHRIWAKK
jgi:large subunit ribosomal protein L22